MAYNAQDARRQMVRDVGSAIDLLADAVAALGEAYEELDEATADRLETELFRPVQSALALAQRTHNAFAERHGIPTRSFGAGGLGTHTGDPRIYLERAVDAVESADAAIAELQDSLMPVEVGDPELRAGLAETRVLISRVPDRGRALIRARGR